MQFAYHKLDPAGSRGVPQKGKGYNPMQGLLYSMMFSGGESSADMLKSLYPYIGSGRGSIARMVELNRSAQVIYRMQEAQPQEESRRLSAIERYIAIIRTLRSYCSPGLAKKFSAMEESFERMEELSSQFGAFSQDGSLSMEQLLPILMSQGLGDDDKLSRMLGMLQMMKLMQASEESGEVSGASPWENPAMAELFKKKAANKEK